jgi:hypothetical protein
VPVPKVNSLPYKNGHQQAQDVPTSGGDSHESSTSVPAVQVNHNEPQLRGKVSLTFQEAASISPFSVSTLRTYARKGWFTAIKPAGKFMIDRESFENFLRFGPPDFGLQPKSTTPKRPAVLQGRPIPSGRDGVVDNSVWRRKKKTG